MEEERLGRCTTVVYRLLSGSSLYTICECFVSTVYCVFRRFYCVDYSASPLRVGLSENPHEVMKHPLYYDLVPYFLHIQCKSFEIYNVSHFYCGILILLLPRISQPEIL